MPDVKEHKGMALFLLCLVQFMVVLDIAIVNVALPSIQDSLHFSETNLSWVINAYTLTFGGLLLLGGRAADLLGRRRIFIAGLLLFSVASAACGFANSDEFLIIARAIQGVGAAMVSPAALAILVTTFEEGPERNKALGIWGAIAGSGGAAGVLLGGILTQELNWSWIFFINVPVGLAVIAAAPVYLRESKVEGAHPLVRPARCDPRPRRACRCWCTRWCRRSTTPGRRRARSACSSPPSCCWPAFIATERRVKAPLMPLQHLPQPLAVGGQRRGADAGSIDLLDVLPADAVHAAGAGLLAAQDGNRLPAGVGHDHRLGRRVTGAGDQDRRAHGAGRRAWA